MALVVEVDTLVTAEVGEHENVNIFGFIERSLYSFPAGAGETAMDGETAETE